MLDLAGQDVLVLGLGISGRSAADFCAARGARVVAADERTGDVIPGLDALAAGVETVLGRPFPDPGAFDLVVPSPGVPPERYRDRARRVWGDVELAWRALSVPVIAVTGTNGKSTTTRLIEALLRSAGFRARAAGNVGEPVLSLVGEALDAVVIEVSSFQLETTEGFRPRVAVILNVTPDHLDRHGSFEAYVEAKARILACQQDDDVACLNQDDPATAALADRVRGRAVPFRTAGPLPCGGWLDMGAVVLRSESGQTERVSLDGLRLRGAHNRENTVAALTAVWAFGADVQKASRALADFDGLTHRMERVAERGGITWINDSKATNPGAAVRSIESVDGALVWIGGGKDKDLDFGPLADAVGARARVALLLGEASAKLARALGGRVPTETAASIEDAVARAAELAHAGDVVLLAPACASQDQFRDFEERGDRFRAAVQALAERTGTEES
jgi:UDP-N-acetylmuramoylalanine--D-glutamate ligase